MDLAEVDLGQYDDADPGLSGQSAEDLGDFTIDWIDGEKRFDPALIRAKLVMKGRDLDVEFGVDYVFTKPENVIEVEHDTEASTPKVAVFNVRLTDEVLGAKNFYDRVKEPVKVTIVTSPTSAAIAAVTTAPEKIEQTCHVGVKVPPARIRWEDPKRPGLPEPEFDVEPDGKDGMELHVWLERWDPALKRIATDDSVEFTHMTNKRFDPEVFGPDPSSRPWVIAQPGSGDKRTCSLWKSRTALPAPNRPETLPWDGRIRVRARRAGDIRSRGVGTVDLRRGAPLLAEAFVTVRLGNSKIIAKLISPELPIPADGEGHEVVLQFVRERSGAPVGGVEVSGTLETGARYPGGSFDPPSQLLPEGGDGKAKFTYYPPKLTYRPGAAYDQDLRCYVGPFDKRVEAGGVVLFVSPEVRAELTAKKCGLDWELIGPYTLIIPPDRAPDRVIPHVGFVSVENGFDDPYDVNDALPKVTVLAAGERCDISIDMRTNDRGIYQWMLPELAPGLAKVAMDDPRRRLTLEPFKQEVAADLDEISLAIAKRYQQRLTDTDAVLSRLVLHSLHQKLGSQPKVMAKHLCEKLETDCEKCREGLRIEAAMLAGTALVDRLATDLLEIGLQRLGELIKALWEVVYEFMRLGERIFGLLAQGFGKLGPRALQALTGTMDVMVRIIAPIAPDSAIAIRLAIAAVRNGNMGGDQAIKELWSHAHSGVSRILENGVLNMTQSAVHAVDSAVSSGLLSRALAKSRKEVITRIGKLLSKVINSGITWDPQTSQTYLRDALGLSKLEHKANRVVAVTMERVETFAYPGVPGTAAAYLEEYRRINNEIDRQKRQSADISQAFGGLAAMADYVVTFTTAMAFLGAFLAPETAGASIAITLGALATREVALRMAKRVPKLLDAAAKGYSAYVLIPLYEELLTVYETRTLQMTDPTPTSTP